MDLEVGCRGFGNFFFGKLKLIKFIISKIVKNKYWVLDIIIFKILFLWKNVLDLCMFMNIIL